MTRLQVAGCYTASMVRRLLNFASIIGLAVCLAATSMCVRSYFDWDQLRGHIPKGFNFAVYTTPGRIVLLKYGATWQTWPWELTSGPERHRLGLDAALSAHAPDKHLGWFTKSFSGLDFSVIVPFWIMVLASGSIALVLRMGWPPRFTIRSLFVVSTFLAMVLGMIAYLDRLWVGR
jgi:hypothetical protein